MSPFSTADNRPDVNQEMTKRAAELTTSAAEKLEGKRLTIETAVRNGDARSVIVAKAKKWSADLIVLGSHGYWNQTVALGQRSIVGCQPCSLFG